MSVTAPKNYLQKEIKCDGTEERKKVESSSFVQGVPIKMRHLVSFISPSVLMIQLYALHGQ